MSDSEKENTDDLVFTTRIRLRNGRVIYASSYGLKAFCFPRPEPKTKKKAGGTTDAEAA